MLSSSHIACKQFAKWFLPTHEWIDIEGNVGTVGISNYAAHHLGDIVFADFHIKEVEAGDELGDIEASKTTTAILSPMKGKVTEVNPLLADDPSIIVRSAERKGWLCKLLLNEPTDTGKLMNVQTYRDSIKT